MLEENLNEAQLALALIDLNEGQGVPWIIKEKKLHKSFEFVNFVSAFGFITQVALCAQRLNHHPDWSNRYKVVEFNLSTHKCNGISALDFELANIIDKYGQTGRV